MRFLTRSSRGMTLTELIVASVLVGIVTLGLVAAEQAVRMSRQSSSRDNLVTTQMQAMMLTITRDVNMMSGDYASPGFFMSRTGGNLRAICLRHADGDVNTYIDDRWNCWTFSSPPSSGDIYSCTDLAATTTDCTAVTGFQTWNTPRYESITILPFDNAGTNLSSFSGTIQNMSITGITVRLQTRFDLNKDENPISNPQYILESILSPPGLSR